MENIHVPVKNSQIHQCSKCDFQSLESRDLNAHVQTNHKSVMINIDVEEQIALNCQQCEYKCRLNIQLKKHIETKHKVKDDTKYNCKECGYKSNFIADAWKHTLDEHPDKSYDFDKQEKENLILKIVAEQNSIILDEFEGVI